MQAAKAGPPQRIEAHRPRGEEVVVSLLSPSRTKTFLGSIVTANAEYVL